VTGSFGWSVAAAGDSIGEDGAVDFTPTAPGLAQIDLYASAGSISASSGSVIAHSGFMRASSSASEASTPQIQAVSEERLLQ
jgi:hypothetical protein